MPKFYLCIYESTSQKLRNTPWMIAKHNVCYFSFIYFYCIKMPHSPNWKRVCLLQSWFEKYFSCHRWWNQFSNEYSITVANFAPLKGEQNKSLNHNHSCSMFTLPRNMNGSNFGQPQPYLLCYACRLEKQPSHGGYYVRSIFKSQGFASSSLDFTKIQSDH